MIRFLLSTCCFCCCFLNQVYWRSVDVEVVLLANEDLDTLPVVEDGQVFLKNLSTDFTQIQNLATVKKKYVRLKNT